MLITAISLAVAAVPEGLPAVVTIVLALSVSRMVRVNTIVRRLPSVETLGAVSVVCSDKTGTLTQNKMTVEEFLDAGELLMQRGNKEELYHAFLLCNDGKLTKKGPLGDPTELALLEYGRKMQVEASALEKEFPRVMENPFDSGRKMMTTVHKTGNGLISYTKGAPDIILSRCSRYLAGTEVKELGAGQKKRIAKQIDVLSGRALRVLGAAMSDGDGREERDMVFLGLAAMADPPRPEASRAVSMFQKAHVRTVMITGDHKDTAFAIARKLGIASRESQCMSGEELDRADEEELKERAEQVSVFARVSSDHKVRIVKALKASGKIVAMTGDGVNDAPSLKAADVGIAMGQCGTDVAKQAADMILTDDNFATIEKAMEEGRGIYENIRKSVIFLLSSNFGEIMTMFTAIILSLPSPLKASHILWINLITDSLPAIAIGMEPPEDGLLKEPPRNPREGILTASFIRDILVQGGLIAAATMWAYTTGLHEGGPGRACTMAFSTLTLARLFHGFNCRSSHSIIRLGLGSNLYSVMAFQLGALLLAAVLFVPGLQIMFAAADLSLSQLSTIVSAAFLPTLVIQIHKIIKESIA